MEFLQGAFESYKSSLHQEMHDKWKVKEEELKQECEDAKQAAIHEMSKMLNSLSRLLVWSWLLADLLVVWRLGCGDDIDGLAGVEEELAKLVERLDKTYRKMLRISYKDHVTNEEVRAKIQQAI